MRKQLLILVMVPVCASFLMAQNAGYVVDNSLGQVKVVDLGLRRVSATIPAGREPSELLILPNNRVAFVSNQGDNNVSMLDLTGNVRLSSIGVGQAPGSLASSPDSRFVYVANEGSNDISVIDVASRSVLATVPVDATPVAVNLSPDGRFLYAVNQDATPAGTVSVIDTRRNRVVKTLTVGLKPVQFALAPNQTSAYVINSGSANVSVVDLSLNEVTGTVAVGQGPASGIFSNDGRFFYAVNRSANTISVIDTRQRRAVASIPVGTQPAAIALTFDSKFAYVSNQGSASVSVLDLTANTTETTITVGNGPFDAVMDPNEDFLYVTNLNSQSISVIDMNADRLAATIPVGGTPIQFLFLNSPTLLELAPNPAPSGGEITLSGEGFLPSSKVRLTTATPPRTVTIQPTFLDSQGLRVMVPSFQGTSAAIEVDNADGSASESLTLATGSAAPIIFSGGVVEGAGFQRPPYPVSPGSFVTVAGSFPGVGIATAPSFPLPGTLGNARVTFNGVPAPLWYSSSNQINLVAPVALAQPSVRVAVSVQGQTSRVETVNTSPAAPGIFVISADSAGAFLHGTRPTALVTPSDPSVRGEVLVMYMTGLGTTLPRQFDGEPTPSDVLSPADAQPVVSVGGSAAKVLYSGVTAGYSGLYQINFEVPQITASGNDVIVTVSAGALTSNNVRLAVQ